MGQSADNVFHAASTQPVGTPGDAVEYEIRIRPEFPCRSGARQAGEGSGAFSEIVTAGPHLDVGVPPMPGSSCEPFALRTEVG
jgi:hypothetical protein